MEISFFCGDRGEDRFFFDLDKSRVLEVTCRVRIQLRDIVWRFGDEYGVRVWIFGGFG